MAWTRKRTNRRRRVNKRVYRKYRGKPKGIRKSQNTVYSYTRYGNKQTIYLNSVEQDTAFQFQFNDIAQYTDFTPLYDQYKLKGVKLFFRLVTNPDAPSATMSNTFVYPSMWHVPDRDDGNAITLNQIREKQGVKRKVLLPNRIVSMYVKTTCAPEVYDLPVVGYAVSKALWMDMNSTSVPHYGLKAVFENCGVSGLGQYQIEVEKKYYFSCKGTQ